MQRRSGHPRKYANVTYGFTVEMLVELMRAGLATAQTDRCCEPPNRVSGAGGALPGASAQRGSVEPAQFYPLSAATKRNGHSEAAR